MGESNKLVVIGLDSADPDLVEQWAAEGYLPTFRRLFDGAYGHIKNPKGLEAGSCWPTFYYGVNPGRHGQYDGTRFFDAENYRDSKYTSEMLSASPIWTVLNQAGKKIALVDAPYRFRTEDLNGIDIHDWGTHAPTGKNSFATFSTNPPELATEIEEKFGLDPLGGAMCDKYRPRTLAEQRSFLEMMVDRATRKGQMAADLLGREDWDFYLACFSECHCIGHHAWHLHDPGHPDHEPEIAKELGNPVLAVYKAVDAAIGSILERVPEDATVVVYCSHGMGLRYSGTKLLDKILVRLEGGKPREVSDPLTRSMRKIWRALPLGIRNSLKPTQAKLYKRIYHDGFEGNREGRRFFEILANDGTAGVRINLVGREPHGKVHPGAEFDAVCAELTEKLLKIVNPDTGQPLVREVHRSSDVFKGDHRDRLPDLLVTWNRVGSLNRVSSPDIGELVHENLSFRTGDHRPEGLFFAFGGTVTADGNIGTVDVVDFAPTFANLLGTSMPATDGTPISVFTFPDTARDAKRARSKVDV